MPLSQQDIDGSMQIVIDTFKELRPELMASYGNIEHSSKHDNSQVTELDVKVETIIKGKLVEQYPHIGFHGEETEDIEGASGALWVVDPIDGTSSFTHGLPYCTNMAGLVVDGETVAAVIYQFVTDELFTATKGGGAFKNGERISIKNTELDNSLVFAASFAYKNLHNVFKQYRTGLYAPIGASGYEFTRLAQGNIQGVIKLRGSSQMHDDVPGVLIAREAGAVVESFDGNEYTYKTLQFVIGTPNLIQVVKDHKAEITKIIQR